jgi:phosphatidylglycerophosphate synthase
MLEETITQQESLAIIESMINKAKNRFSENGFLYLLWGWVILFCSLGQYVLLFVFHYPQHWIVWLSTWLALIVQFIYIYRKRRAKRVITYTEEILRYVWITFVILLFILCFLLSGKQNNPNGVIDGATLLAIYGMPTFLSGIILRFKGLVIGGVSCWVLSVAAAFAPNQYQLLFVAAGVVIAWIIPGYLLRARFKQENA